MSPDYVQYNPDHPVNASVLAGMYRSWSLGDYDPDDPYTENPRIKKIRSKFANTLRDDLHGWVALSTPNNGVIFAVIDLVDRCAALRLPPDAIEQSLVKGAVRSAFVSNADQRSRSNSDTRKTEHFHQPVSMGDDWVILENYERFDDAWWHSAYNHTAQIEPYIAIDSPERRAAMEAAAAKLDRQKQLSNGIDLRGKSDLDGAIAIFTTLIENNPAYIPAYLERADTYQRQGKVNEAIADLSHVIELDPTHEEAYHHRAEYEKASGAMDAALADYQKAVELMSHEDFFYSLDQGYIAKMFEEKGNLDAAIATYTTMIETISAQNEIADKYERRASLYTQQQRYSKAVADYERAFEIWKGLATAKPHSGYANANSMKHLDELNEEIARLTALQGNSGPG